MDKTNVAIIKINKYIIREEDIPSFNKETILENIKDYVEIREVDDISKKALSVSPLNPI